MTEPGLDEAQLDVSVRSMMEEGTTNTNARRTPLSLSIRLENEQAADAGSSTVQTYNPILPYERPRMFRF